MILLKVIIAKNAWFATIRFLIMGLNDLLMQCVNISNIAIITVKGGDCYCIIHDISKSNTFNLLENSVLDDRGNM